MFNRNVNSKVFKRIAASQLEYDQLPGPRTISKTQSNRMVRRQRKQKKPRVKWNQEGQIDRWKMVLEGEKAGTLVPSKFFTCRNEYRAAQGRAR